jgi:hypothetical protein
VQVEYFRTQFNSQELGGRRVHGLATNNE